LDGGVIVAALSEVDATPSEINPPTKTRCFFFFFIYNTTNKTTHLLLTMSSMMYLIIYLLPVVACVGAKVLSYW
jgi:hypothetical protein